MARAVREVRALRVGCRGRKESDQFAQTVGSEPHLDTDAGAETGH